jgi:hypothetical protein
VRIGRREAKRRLIGLTLPTVLGTGGGAATWTIEQGDKARARSVLQDLEDRRVLYDPYDVELPDACIMSVREIRGYLRMVVGQCNSSALRDPLRAIQAACRQFLTDAEAIGGADRIHVVGGGSESWLFNQALGSLRARVGTSIAVIVGTFDINVDEHLARIMPPRVSDEDENA